MRVGWIGLGRVGKYMALQVLGAGHDLIGHSRRPDHHQEVADAGGRLTTSVEAAVSGAELVCVNVFSDDQLRDALIAKGGLAAMAPGAILAIHSTVSPGLIAELAGARPDIAVLDAGFSGSAEDTQVGGLTLMVGGEAQALKRAEPVFRCYAKTIAHLGPSGAGMTVKILNNLMFAAHMNLGREAIAIAKSSGISAPDLLAALQGGSAASYALGVYLNSPDPESRFEAVRPYMEKDVSLGLEALPDLQVIRESTSVFLAKPAIPPQK